MNGWVLTRAAPAICKQSAGATHARIIIAMKAYVVVSFLNRSFKWRSCVSDRQWRSLKVVSYVARQLAIMICGQKTDSSSCVARQMTMICGQKTNSPSCVARKMSMICGQKTNSPSCIARKTAIICGCKTNLSLRSCVELREKSNVSILVSQRPLYHICGKFITASHTELSLKASIDENVLL